MKYSLLVAIYNIEPYLRNCLKSIQNQTFKDFEAILVDDGSTDGSPEICDEFSRMDSRFKVIHKINGGLVTARKAGVEAAQGDYVCFIDGDDFVAPDMLSSYEEVLHLQSVDMLCGGYTSFRGGTEEPVRPRAACGFYNKRELLQDIYPRMLSDKPFFSFYIMPSICVKCFRRNLLLDIYALVPDNISLGEDAAVTYPSLLKSNSIAVINSVAYRYRENRSSMTHSYDPGLFEKLVLLINYLKKVRDNSDFDITDQLNDYIAFLAYLAATNEFFYNKTDSFSVKRRNMKRFLDEPNFKEALRKVDLRHCRYRLLPVCLKHRWIFLMYLAGIYKDLRYS